MLPSVHVVGTFRVDPQRDSLASGRSQAIATRGPTNPMRYAVPAYLPDGRWLKVCEYCICDLSGPPTAEAGALSHSVSFAVP